MVGPELHHVSVLCYFQVYIGLLSHACSLRTGMVSSSGSHSSSKFSILVFFNDGGYSSVSVLCGTGILSHLSIPIPTGFPWENGKREFPFPMNTSICAHMFKFSLRRQLAPLQSIKFQTANFPNFPIFCSRIIVIL